jgi:hypothetical protein
LPKVCLMPTSPGRITAQDERSATAHPMINILVFIFLIFDVY